MEKGGDRVPKVPKEYSTCIPSNGFLAVGAVTVGNLVAF